MSHLKDMIVQKTIYIILIVEDVFLNDFLKKQMNI